MWVSYELTMDDLMGRMGKERKSKRCLVNKEVMRRERQTVNDCKRNCVLKAICTTFIFQMLVALSLLM